MFQKKTIVSHSCYSYDGMRKLIEYSSSKSKGGKNWSKSNSPINNYVKTRRIITDCQLAVSNQPKSGYSKILLRSATYDLGIMYYDLGIMYYLNKILLRILPWVPRSPRCSKNLVRSYFTKTAKMLVRGSTQVKLKISRIN